MTAAVRSVESIRGDFPALERQQGGHPVAYFDGPGGTQVPRAVVDAMSDYLLHHNANTHWAYPTSQETDAALAHARECFADFLNATPDDISFGSNMTTITFHLARGLARGWEPGDEIVVTELDHHANIAPWHAVAQERGLVIRTVPLDTATMQHEAGGFDRLIGPRTRLVALGAASNALGTITDVRAVCALARERGALSFVDAVHLAPHVLVDVRDIGCDFLACSPYKFYGPHLGVLYAAASLLQSVDVPKLQPSPNDAPERIETGTQNHEGIVGAAAAVEWMASLAPWGAGATRRERLVRVFDELHRRAELLQSRLRDGLDAIPGVAVHAAPRGTPRSPTVAFTVGDTPSEQVARALAAQAVFVSHGDFYATTVAERLGHAADGLVRAGAACYTTDSEIDRLLEGVARRRHEVVNSDI